jgi:hypothetical protein
MEYIYTVLYSVGIDEPNPLFVSFQGTGLLGL